MARPAFELLLERTPDGGRRQLLEDIAMTMGGERYNPKLIPGQTAGLYADFAGLIQEHLSRFQDDAVRILPDLIKMKGIEGTKKTLAYAGRIRDSDFPSKSNVALFYLGMESGAYAHSLEKDADQAYLNRIKAKCSIP